MLKDQKRVESPLPVLMTQMLDETIAQRREKVREANKAFSNQKQSIPIEKPQFIRTIGASIPSIN